MTTCITTVALVFARQACEAGHARDPHVFVAELAAFHNNHYIPWHSVHSVARSVARVVKV